MGGEASGCGPQGSNKGLVTFWRTRADCTEPNPRHGGLCMMQGLEVALVCLETVWEGDAWRGVGLE